MVEKISTISHISIRLLNEAIFIIYFQCISYKATECRLILFWTLGDFVSLTLQCDAPRYSIIIIINFSNYFGQAICFMYVDVIASMGLRPFRHDSFLPVI